MVNYTIDIYFHTICAPSRAVLLLIKALGLKHNIKEVNILAGEQMNPSFLKLNPLHTLPVVNDNGFVLYDSAVIMKYLVDQYAKDDSLYPRDPKKRALVDQRLYFVAGYLQRNFADYYLPQIHHGSPTNEDSSKKLAGTFENLNGFLEDHKWIAGDNMTIADFLVITVIATIDATGMFDFSKYKNLYQWYYRAKTAMSSFGYQEINAGSEVFADLLKSKLN